MKGIDEHTALVMIDVQRAIDHPSWGARNHPYAEQAMAALLARWRERAMPVYHVRHDSVEPNSTYRPGQTGNQFKPEAAPLAGEPIFSKNTGSGFANTGLAEALRGAGIHKLVVAGVITNNSVETTVRHGACLGFEIYLAEDACFTFGKHDAMGRYRHADEIHAMSLANLAGEYCTVVNTSWVLAQYREAPPR